MQHADVADLRGRRPDLLAGDDPLVAVLDRLRGRAREVGAGAGLREQLAPRVLPVEDAEQVFLLLTLVAVRDDRRRGEQIAETGRRTDRAVARRSSRSRPSRDRAASPCPTRPRGSRRRVPGPGEDVPPLRHGELGVPVLLEPRLDLGPYVFGARHRHDLRSWRLRRRAARATLRLGGIPASLSSLTAAKRIVRPVMTPLEGDAASSRR